MPIITFWSSNEKTNGQTVSAAVAATTMAMEHNYKVLLVSADFNNLSMEECFGAQETNRDIVKSLIKTPQMNLDSGINGLIKLANSNRVTPEIIHDYTKIIYKNRFEILYSPNNIIDKQEMTRILEDFKNIILHASRYYDYVLVDLKKGFEFEAQKEILNSSDVVVLNVNQNIKAINETLNQDITKAISRKILWNICRYDKKSKYNTKNLTRQILKKQFVCETNYNTYILEASQDGTLAEMILRFRTLKEDDENMQFYTKEKELVQAMLLKYQETRV
jgi:CO dehydrogenase nickel-insertion accessory protein CooC1